MSSGVVSQRTRITGSPVGPRCLRPSSASNTSCADGRAGGGVRPLGDHVELAPRVDRRMQQLVELAAGRSAGGPRRGRSRPRRPGRGRSAPRRPRCACRAGLQQVERAPLDRELDVLHLAVMAPRAAPASPRARRRSRAARRQRRSRLGRADPGHHVRPGRRAGTRRTAPARRSAGRARRRRR